MQVASMHFKERAHEKLNVEVLQGIGGKAAFIELAASKIHFRVGR